mgnify:CR=1 FL=1
MNASYGVVRRETSTLSSDGHSWLRMLIWLPDSTYTRRGIVQIIHGMSEHIGRYDHFAAFWRGWDMSYSDMIILVMAKAPLRQTI